MTWHEPSRAAKGAAASVSAVVFVALVVHAQWGCDRVGEPPATAAERAPAGEIAAPGGADDSASPTEFAPAESAAPGEPAPTPASAPEDDPDGRAAEPAEAKVNPKRRRTNETTGREGVREVIEAMPRPYLSSSKSDPDMWARDFQIPSSTANQAPETQSDR